MNTALKALGVIVLAAASSAGVVYLDAHCPDKQAQQQKMVEAAAAKYIASHPAMVLEQIAKSENFGDTIKNFSSAGEEEINNRIKDYFENNPGLFEDYIRHNADFIASMVIESEEFKSQMDEVLSKAKEAAGNGDVQNAPKPKEVNDEQQQNLEQEEATENPNQIYLDHWEEMQNSEAAPSVGPNDAKVAVVEFFDFACGHCRSLAPVMGELIKNNPDVKFVFNPLYFISEHSNYAAKAAMAAAEKGKFVEVYEGIMTLPDMNEEAINQILADEGIDVLEAKKLMEEKKIRRGSQDIDALSQVLGINGVPMLFINGEVFYGRSLEDLQAKINSYK